MFYSTNKGANTYSLVEGVQQPYEISIVSGIRLQNGLNLEISAFPNPTSDFLTLNVENFNNEKLFYKLFDIKGNLLERKKLTVKETLIKMEMLVPANYFLKIFDNQEVIKTFKIIIN